MFTKVCSSGTEAGKHLHRQYKEFIEACQDYNGIVTQARLIAQKRNGVAERALRRMQEGTAIAPVQSGLPDERWDCAMECSYYLRNVHDKKWPMARQHSRKDMVDNWRTTNSLRNMG